MKKLIRVVIADDHPLILKGLQFILSDTDDIEVVGATTDGKTALDLISELKPDLAILDSEMPNLRGTEIAERIRRFQLPVNVILFTVHTDRDIFDSAINAGVKGYLLKESMEDEILRAIREVQEGGYYICPKLSGHLMEAIGQSVHQNHTSHLKSLTAAELLVIKLVAENAKTAEIAVQLNLSVRTIDRHRSNICKKLSITGNNALLHYVLENREEILSV